MSLAQSLPLAHCHGSLWIRIVLVILFGILQCLVFCFQRRLRCSGLVEFRYLRSLRGFQCLTNFRNFKCLRDSRSIECLTDIRNLKCLRGFESSEGLSSWILMGLRNVGGLGDLGGLSSWSLWNLILRNSRSRGISGEFWEFTLLFRRYRWGR